MIINKIEVSCGATHALMLVTSLVLYFASTFCMKF